MQLEIKQEFRDGLANIMSRPKSKSPGFIKAVSPVPDDVVKLETSQEIKPSNPLARAIALSAN
jgi:hypothetical protein